MFQKIKKSSLASLALLTVGVSTYGEELLIWQIPDVKGKTPLFYQDASKSSKTMTVFKPHQTVQVLSKQKEWSKVSALDNSGQIAWVLTDELKALTTLNVSLKQEANSYQCQVRVKDPAGREAGNWRLAHRMFDPSDKANKGMKGWSFGRKNKANNEDHWVQDLNQLEDAFAKQHAAMMNMMRHMFVTIEEPSDKAGTHSETSQVTEKSKEESVKPNETKIEEKVVTVKQEK